MQHPVQIDLGLSKHLKLTNLVECGLATALCGLPSLKSIEISLNQIEGLSVLGAFTFVCVAAALMGLAPLTINISEVQSTTDLSLSLFLFAVCCLLCDHLLSHHLALLLFFFLSTVSCSAPAPSPSLLSEPSNLRCPHLLSFPFACSLLSSTS